MFGNLSAIILYYFMLKHNIKLLPWIVPLLIMGRCFVLLTANNSIYRKLLILTGINVKIEYYLSIIISILILFCIYLSNDNIINYKNYVLNYLIFVIVIYILLLIIQAYNVLN